MKPGTIGLGLFAAGLFVLGHISLDVAEAQTSRARLNADPQYTTRGTEGCLACHGGENMTVMGDTPHGKLENPHSPYSQQGCESCHGPGSIHVSRAGGGAGYPLLLSFKNDDDIPEQNAACMNCHAETLGELEGFTWAGSLHDGAGMSCQDCHQGHTTERAMWDKEEQKANCSGCHRRQIENHKRFESAGIVFDKLSCSTCHAVHELEDEE